MQTIVDTILKHGRTGAVGDGKVFVMPVEEAYRIRTGESGEETLQAHPDAAAHGGRPRHAMAGAAGSDRDPPPRVRPDGLVERLRAVHLRMVDAVLGGDGLGTVAELAAEAAGAPVAIIVPRLGAAPSPAGRRRGRAVAELRRYVGDRVARPAGAGAARARGRGRRSRSGDEPRRRGRCCSTGAGDAVAPRRAEFLHLAAVASLTEVAVEEAREEVEQNLRGSFLEDLRARPRPRRRASSCAAPARLGCDLSRGAVVAVRRADDRPPAPRRRDDRRGVPGRAGPAHGAAPSGGTRACYALLPARRRRRRARGDARRGARGSPPGCERHGTVGLSSFYADPAELGRAIQEAELVLDVLAAATGRGRRPEDIGTGTYRLLFRVLASHPEEVRSFYEDTVAPLVALRRPVPHRPRRDARGLPRAELQHERDGGGDLRPPPHGRLPARARARADRASTRCSPRTASASGLGLKAYRIIAPRLPR